MKQAIVAVVLLLGTMQTKAQTPYTCNADPNHPGGKIYNGIITKYALINDTSFKWYASSQQIYTPKKEVLNAMSAANGKYKFILFGGSWCEDTQFILPKFFKLQEQAGIPDSDISFIGVDRNKSSLGNLAAAFNVKNVPTIIVLKDGIEAGRIVEYGKTGEWDKELAELLK